MRPLASTAHLAHLTARFRRNHAGATAVEFALVAFPFVAMITAIFELGYVEYENEALQASLHRAIRQMTTGQMQTAGVKDVATFEKTYLCQTGAARTLPANFDCAKLIVAIAPVSSFTSADMGKSFYRNASNPFCPAAPGQFAMIKVAYPLATIFPLNLFNPAMALVNDVPGRPGYYHLLMGSALFQTESYSGSYTPPSGC